MVSGFLLDIVLNGNDLIVSDFANAKIKVIRDGLIQKSYQVGQTQHPLHLIIRVVYYWLQTTTTTQ